MPQGAKLLHANVQADAVEEWVVCVWADVDTLQPDVKRDIQPIPTGMNAPEDGEYFATVHIPTELGPLVFHLYDRGEL